MGINNPELSFETLYLDEDLLQIEVIASNGKYAGITTFYLNPNETELVEFAKKLLSFPQYIGQVVRHKFGFSQDELIDLKKKGFKGVTSFVDLHFYCVDKLGHSALRINLIEESWSEQEDDRDNVSLELQFDPASLDVFVQELIVLAETKKGKATLKGDIAVKGGYY